MPARSYWYYNNQANGSNRRSSNLHFPTAGYAAATASPPSGPAAEDGGGASLMDVREQFCSISSSFSICRSLHSWLQNATSPLHDTHNNKGIHFSWQSIIHGTDRHL